MGPSNPGNSGGWVRRLLGRRGGPRAPRRAADEQAVELDAAAVESALAAATAQTGEELLALSARRPRLVVFLRHLGCNFCREALADLARTRRSIEGRGIGIVLVHLARDDARAERLFAVYKLADVPRVADPERHLYLAVGLDRAATSELLGPRVLLRMIDATCHGYLRGRAVGDVRQLPGVFVIHRGRILAAFRHRTAADRPDYLGLAERLAEARPA